MKETIFSFAVLVLILATLAVILMLGVEAGMGVGR